MRILEITGEPIVHGGQESFIMNCITHMEAEFHVDILTPYCCNNYLYQELLSERGGRIYELHLPFIPGKSRRNLYTSVRGFLKNHNYDVVHIHSGSISALAYMAKAAKKEGVGNIIVHSHSTGIRNLKHLMVQYAFSHMMKKNPTHFCACTEEAGQMKFPRSVANNKLIILKNGIDIDRFTYDSSKREELRKKFAISKEAFVIGHVGRFTYEKNHSFLLRIFSKLLKQKENAWLMLVGDGELKDSILKEAENLGIENRVIFTGAVDEIWNYYQMMDVFVLPSIYEGFPISALEAQASGLPVVISTGVSEEIVLCDHVIRINLDFEDEWVAAMLQSPVSRATGNGEIIKNKGYSIMDTVHQLTSIYRDT